MEKFADASTRATLPDLGLGEFDRQSSICSVSSDFDGNPAEDVHTAERNHIINERMAFRALSPGNLDGNDVDRILGAFSCTPYTIGTFPFESICAPSDKDAAWERCNSRFEIRPQEIPGVREVHEALSVKNLTEVYRCSFSHSDGQTVQVALKAFDQYVRPDAAEVELMASLRHPNLVRLHAAIEGFPRALAFEYCAGGTLKSFLHGQPQQEHVLHYGIQTRLVAVQGILSALAFLHNIGAVHRRVEPGNCYLTQKAQAGVLPALKLGGLGGTCAVLDGERTSVGGSFRYMAPELMQTFMCDASVDIFSFGMLLHEFLSGEVPFAEFDDISDGQVMLAIRAGRRPSFDAFSAFLSSPKISHVIEPCWGPAASRPSADTLHSQIEELLCMV